MNDLQQLAKVGKSVLVQLVGTQMNFKTVKSADYIDESVCKCSDCPTYKLKNITPSYEVSKEKLSELEELYCYGKCKKAITSVHKTIYHNECNQYKIPKGNKRLSKLQIKQLILFHFYPVDNQGIVKKLSIKRIASILNCTEKTVRANNQKLVEQEFIWISPMDNDRFTVLIKEYKTYHLTSKEGGNGYLYMSLELMQEILGISDVNSLRLEIRKIIHFDNYNIGTKEARTVELSYKEIRRFLPDYVNYKNLIDEIVSNQSKAFNTIQNEDSIVFKLKEEFSSDNIIEIRSYDYSEKFEMLLNKENIAIDEGYKQDLIQMSFQYNFETVYESVEEIIEKYIKKEKEIKNFGGLVREISKNILRGKATA